MKEYVLMLFLMIGLELLIGKIHWMRNPFAGVRPLKKQIIIQHQSYLSFSLYLLMPNDIILLCIQQLARIKTIEKYNLCSCPKY